MKHFIDSLKDIRILLKMIRSISKLFFPLLIITSLIRSSLPFVNIIFSYLILDGLVSGIDRSVLMMYIYEMVALNVILGILGALLNATVKVKGDYINYNVTSQIADKSLTLDYEELEKQENMELLFKAREGTHSHGGITSFCQVLSNVLNHLVTLIYAIILLSGLFIYTPITDASRIVQIFNSVYLTIGLFFLIALSLAINFRIMNQINKRSYQHFEKNVDVNRKFGYFLNLSTNYKLGKDIRLYQMSDMIEKEMGKLYLQAGIPMRKLGLYSGKKQGLIEVINQFIVFFTYGFVGIKAILGLITIGSVLKFVSVLIKFHSSLSAIIFSWVQLDIQRQYLNNYVKFLNLKNKKYEGTLPIEKRDDGQYEIEFKDVSFHYPNTEELILNHINIRLKVGQKMAIVGKNGAGKTTFIKLLCRLYDPTAGEILLNGINIKKYDYQEYLQLFSVVFQDFKLFSFSIGENIATNQRMDEQLVWDVLEQAGIASRIHTMEQGLKTSIYQNEEDGVEISGGEAQKLAIGRALYKNAPLVVLDEPTSALDPISEFEIYSRFDHLVSNKSSIYISHRMSSCRFCDHIFVFDQGQIVQNGNHSSLLNEKEGLYYALWNAQAKYYQ